MDYGNTSLIYAAQKGHLEVVKYLIEHGAKVDNVYDYGNTSLIYAAQN